MEPTLEKQDGNANGRSAPASAYCAFCGIEVDSGEAAARSFGERFCTQAHAEAFAGEVRATRAAVAAEGPTGGAPGDARQTPRRGDGRWSLGRLLKLGACCGLPILAVVLLAGGGGSLLGAGAVALPYLALLACPLGMFFMMRGMQHHGSKHDQRSREHAPGSTAPSRALRERQPGTRSPGE